MSYSWPRPRTPSTSSLSELVNSSASCTSAGNLAWPTFSKACNSGSTKIFAPKTRLSANTDSCYSLRARLRAKLSSSTPPNPYPSAPLASANYKRSPAVFKRKAKLRHPQSSSLSSAPTRPPVSPPQPQVEDDDEIPRPPHISEGSPDPVTNTPLSRSPSPN